MVQIRPTKKQIHVFQEIVNQYKNRTDVPKKNYWTELNNNDLWLWLVGQVMVVGGSAGNDRFQQRPDLRKRLSYTTLKNIRSEEVLKQTINSVLCECGIRYASSTLTQCHKTNAIAHNLRVITSFNKGFIGLLTHLSKIEGENAEMDRVRFLMRRLKYIKSKSARDFLMSMGINRNTVAIDVRIQNVFKWVGISLPAVNELARESVYRKTETQIIEKVCNVLNIEPVKFDRILYQNYSLIKKKTPTAL